MHWVEIPTSVVGWSCRVPGAPSIEDFWSLLIEGRCAISQVPPDRFNRDHFFHPGAQARGRSYTWAAGVIDDIYGFDPLAFGISPREAPQLDPQQRILLQLTWEALEDAGIKPSSIAGTETGVYVGASLTEYAHGFIGDPSAGDSHFATGNSLAVIANRISYIFDLRGPSVTFDTACSSSLVALNAACEALRSGRIETAIVAGINIISAPTSFVSFSQASMVSPTGLCRAFSEGADGFVRAEGGAVLVLRRSDMVGPANLSERGRIIASDVNSDGRTNGISLPSGDAQERLLRKVYDTAGIVADQLAFVEAHGTGTPVGDPIEAGAIGRGLGQSRTDAVLPIGSTKTNIGHLEAASGIAGVVKALLALDRGVLPPSINYTAPNPHIDFDRLNIAVCREPMTLDKPGAIYAGVNSFGFGGTNAHAIVAAAPRVLPAAKNAPRHPATLTISAHSKPALKELASRYRDLAANSGGLTPATIAMASAHRREALSHRLVVSSVRPDVVHETLSCAASDEAHPALTIGEAEGSNLNVVFVYSGNGGQWVGMGQTAYRNNESFCVRFDAIDALFMAEAGWSLSEALFDPDLDSRIGLTSVVQPLVFAIQSSATVALAALGLTPHLVIGHSFGEVAAAESCGALDLATAVKVIHFRSLNQESVRNRGRMAAVMAEPVRIAPLVDRIPGIEIAAHNGPRALTLAGSSTALARFAKIARGQGIPYLDLDLDYPFHSSLMDGIRDQLEAALGGIVPNRASRVPMISTVTGEFIDPSELSAHYWWRNIRQPVRFETAVQAAAQANGRIFVEIGPRAILGKHISATLAAQGRPGVALSVMERDDPVDRDPCLQSVATAWTLGAAVDMNRLVGPDPDGAVALPRYPWQQTPYRLGLTPEAIGWNSPVNHPLCGSRFSSEVLLWQALVDTALVPELAGHRVGDTVILPGTGFLDIILSIGSQVLETDDLRLLDLEILRPLDLSSETREITTRMSPHTNLVEIFSRARLSSTQPVLHARGRVIKLPSSPPAKTWPTGGTVIDAATHYATAAACGLHYNGAFRGIERITVHDPAHITVDLTDQAGSGVFHLDPFRMDCCAQGVIALFPGLMAEERGVAYVPIRLDEVSLYRAHGQPSRALITIRNSNERSILADFIILDAAGDTLAVLTGVTSQAIPVRRMVQLDAVAVIEKTIRLDGSLLGETGVTASPEDVAARLGKPPRSKPADAASKLLDGFATMATYEIAAALGGLNGLSIDILCAQGRWPNALAGWLESALEFLEAAGLAARRGGAWHLAQDDELPRAASLLSEFALEHPAYATDLLVAAELGAVAKSIAAGARFGSNDAPLISASAFDFFDTCGPTIDAGNALLHRVVRETPNLVPQNRALRILQIGYSPQIKRLAALDNVMLTVVEHDGGRFTRAKVELAQLPLVTLLETLPEDKRFDLVLASGMLGRLPQDCDLSTLAARVSPGGMLIATEARRSFFREMIFHFAAAGSPQHQEQTGGAWRNGFKNAGFDAVADHDFGDRLVLVAKIAALKPIPQRRTAEKRDDGPPIIVVLDTPASRNIEIATHLEKTIEAAGLPVVVGLGEPGTPLPVAAENVLIEMLSGTTSDLSRRCLDLKSIAERIGTTRVKLYLLTQGALSAGSGNIDPMSSGIWAFARTLANEFPSIALCKIDLATNCDSPTAASRLAAIIAAGTDETELHIADDAVRAVRIENVGAITERSGEPAPATRLERRFSVHQRVAWKRMARTRPRAGDVEIAVTATGLNFRDLMFSIGLLPDDILEGGLTGPTLGLECTGTVVARGDDVTNVKVGDRVLAFAASAFASHVTLPAVQVAKIPRHVSTEAAATIPVAFMTASYSLETLAQLQPGEWILIHGGAGAVGMAAIQIAHSIGAHVIATAGSPAKRELLQAMGVAHVLDSRSIVFSDQISRLAPGGVAVVLNSLSGEAMERSIACLAPFGRFVELGKRDYVANTPVGLRPFRKNLSYFGVDVDQIMTNRPALGRALVAKIMKKVGAKEYSPLPFTSFEGTEIANAFQLMQQSGHVGKIVVRPPQSGDVRDHGPGFVVDSEKTHLVTGAFSGFGLATARWLADRGARHLVLVGRSGATRDDAQRLVAELGARGVNVLVQSCDVSKRAAVDALFKRMATDMPPLAGIIHSAMVLDDATVANLTADQMRNVFGPKVEGAIHLDRAARKLSSLSYFVVYSSVTTLIGNPGQAAYVAANAFMEGMIRRRRQLGLPGLAIGWGPITDVGVVAESEKLQSSLAKLGGARGFTAREALELMAQALSVSGSDPALCVMTIAPRDGLFGANRLPSLNSPTFAGMVSTAIGTLGIVEKIDLRELLATAPIEVVREKITENVVAQLANVLHLRREDVAHARPLSDMGLDSLMALELAMKLEDTFQIQIQLSGSAGDLTVASLVDEILAHADPDGAADDVSVAADLMSRHFAESVDAAAE